MLDYSSPCIGDDIKSNQSPRHVPSAWSSLAAWWVRGHEAPASSPLRALSCGPGARLRRTCDASPSVAAWSGVPDGAGQALAAGVPGEPLIAVDMLASSLPVGTGRNVNRERRYSDTDVRNAPPGRRRLRVVLESELNDLPC
jgi:hypothetical protein